MKRSIFLLLLMVLLFCVSCESLFAPEIKAGSDVVALRGDTFRQGRAVQPDGSGWRVQWLDGDTPRTYAASDLAVPNSDSEIAGSGSFGLCRTSNTGRWWICRVDAAVSGRMEVSLLEDASKATLSPSDFVAPSEGQREFFVRRSAALLRSELFASQEIKATNPPAGMDLSAQTNQIVLLSTPEGEYYRGICGKVDASTVSISVFSAQSVISAPEENVAPVSGMEFDRSSYLKDLKVGDIIYASPDGARFLPARVESILEEGRFLRVQFADSLSVQLGEDFWLPQSK